MAKPYIASLLNASILILFGCWSYFGSTAPSFTALIPVFIGLVILVLNKGLKNENKIASHAVVLLTVLVLIGLTKPLLGSFTRDNNAAIARILVMMISSIYALIAFVKSFVDVRKNKLRP
ncbi:MAG: hypothetical protein WCX31_19030 [Salinivirgaceae bacterium]|jgi:hypothetical protein